MSFFSYNSLTYYIKTANTVAVSSVANGTTDIYVPRTVS